MKKKMVIGLTMALALAACGGGGGSSSAGSGVGSGAGKPTMVWASSASDNEGGKWGEVAWK